MNKSYHNNKVMRRLNKEMEIMENIINNEATISLTHKRYYVLQVIKQEKILYSGSDGRRRISGSGTDAH